MPRNIDRRVEVLFPVLEQRWIDHILNKILKVYLRDNVKARRMQPDGSYLRVSVEGKQPTVSSQEWFISQRK